MGNRIIVQPLERVAVDEARARRAARRKHSPEVLTTLALAC
jgi:hypothetical protein